MSQLMGLRTSLGKRLIILKNNWIAFRKISNIMTLVHVKLTTYLWLDNVYLLFLSAAVIICIHWDITLLWCSLRLLTMEKYKPRGLLDMHC